MMHSGTSMISVWNNVSRTVNKSLENDVINALNAYQDNYFDILGSIETLQVRGIFPPEHCNLLLEKYSNLDCKNRQQFAIFIIEIANIVTSAEFFQILDLIGLAHLTEEVCTGSIHRQIHRARIPHSKRLQEHFYEIKSHLDDTDPAERRQYLKDRTNYLKLSFGSSENENALTTYANKFALNTWLWVQQCNRDTREIRRILNDMRTNSWPVGVDPILSEIVFESKMAVVSGMEGSFGCAMVHQHNAKQLVREYHDPLTKALTCHDSRYVQQILARNNAADRRSVLKESEIGLRFLVSESNGNHFCVHMERSFLLNIAEHHLLIGNDFHIDRTNQIPVSDLKSAEKVLFIVNAKLHSGQIVERRRDMVYNVCMARLHDVQHNYYMAIMYLRRAEKLSRAGAFFEGEITNISEYKSMLQRIQMQ